MGSYLLLIFLSSFSFAEGPDPLFKLPSNEIALWEGPGEAKLVRNKVPGGKRLGLKDIELFTIEICSPEKSCFTAAGPMTSYEWEKLVEGAGKKFSWDVYLRSISELYGVGRVLHILGLFRWAFRKRLEFDLQEQPKKLAECQAHFAALAKGGVNIAKFATDGAAIGTFAYSVWKNKQRTIDENLTFQLLKLESGKTVRLDDVNEFMEALALAKFLEHHEGSSRPSR